MLQTELHGAKSFTDEHGFTPSELFSSSARSASSSTKSLQERLADACDDDYNDNASSGDEYCILEENDEVLVQHEILNGHCYFRYNQNITTLRL